MNPCRSMMRELYLVQQAGAALERLTGITCEAKFEALIAVSAQVRARLYLRCLVYIQLKKLRMVQSFGIISRPFLNQQFR
jgi:hypothetical protein